MFKNIKKLVVIICVLTFIAMSSQLCFADNEFPTKEITFIVPWAAGGSSDVFCRGMSIVLDKYLGKGAIVVNKPGGAAVPASVEIANSRPDGYTLGFIANGVLSLRPNIIDVPYRLEDYEILVGVSSLPLIITVKADSPWETFDDFVADLKDNPGKYSYGSSGANNFPHLAVIHLCKELDTSIKHVPFGGGAPAVAALLGGHVDFIAQNPSEIKSHIKEGTLRALATFEYARLQDFPELPTVIESGYDVSHTVWNLIVAPTGVPSERIEKLIEAFASCLEDPDVIEMLTRAGSTIKYLPQNEAQARILKEYKIYNELLK
jgi:tripartite-type tricarboxylate transporter receptor subunit TctC